jgi:hypothetical protein
MRPRPTIYPGLAAEFLLGSALSPIMPRPLVVARQRELPCQAKDQRDRVFRDGALVGAPDVGQPSASSREQRLVIAERDWHSALVMGALDARSASGPAS